MTKNSRELSEEQWHSNGDFWGQVKDARILQYLWQSYIEKIRELSNHLAIANMYNVTDIPPTKDLHWETIKNVDGDIIVNYKGEAFSETILDIPELVDGINNINRTYKKDVDYSIDITTQKLSWIITQPSDDYFYAPVVKLYNPTIAQYFNNGFFDVILTNYNKTTHQDILRMLWDVSKRGPTRNNINKVVQIFSGSPFLKYPGRVGISGTSLTIDYAPEVFVIVKDTGIYLCKTESSPCTGTIDGRKLKSVTSTLHIGDICYINGGYYIIMAKEGSDYVVDESIKTSGSASITPYTPLANGIFDECILLDEETKDIYGITPNPVLSGKIFGITHRSNIKDNKIVTHTESLTIDATMVLDINNGDYYSAFTPIYQFLKIRYWEDASLSDRITGHLYPLGLYDNRIVALYNDEIEKIYQISSVSGKDVTLSNYVSKELSTGSSVYIEMNKSDSFVINSHVKEDNGDYTLRVSDTGYPFKIGESIFISIVSTGSGPTKGALTVISDGAYDSLNSEYVLTIKEDIDNIDTFDSWTGAKISLVGTKGYTRQISNIASSVITLSQEVNIDQKDLPWIKKAPTGDFGNSVMLSLHQDTLSGSNTATFTALDSNEIYNYAIIYSDAYEAEVHFISWSDSTRLQFENPVSHNYKVADNAKVILTKTLPYHQGFRLVFKGIASHSTIIGEYPYLEDSIMKGLRMIPSGYDYGYDNEKFIPICPLTATYTFTYNGITGVSSNASVKHDTDNKVIYDGITGASSSASVKHDTDNKVIYDGITGSAVIIP